MQKDLLNKKAWFNNQAMGSERIELPTYSNRKSVKKKSASSFLGLSDKMFRRSEATEVVECREILNAKI